MPINMKDITVEELKIKFDTKEDLILLDVREPVEHQSFNLGGTLIPLGNLINQMDDFEELKEKEVIVYCRSGKRSATAKSFMVEKGFKNVRNLEGGVLDWISKGLS